jgi:hypothetical protein
MSENHVSESDATRAAFAAEIEEFSANIRQYHASLNDEGVWLFLAALGCWSVVGGAYVAMSLSATFLLFAWRLNEKRIEKRGFSKVIGSLRDRITKELPYNERRTGLLNELQKLQETELSVRKVVRSAWPFLISWAFFGATFLHALPSEQ